MFAYYEGVLHSIGEGLVLQDRSNRVVLANDRAAELLGLPDSGRRRSAGAARRRSTRPSVADVLSRTDAGRRDRDHADAVLVVDRDVIVSRPARRARAWSARSRPCATTPSCRSSRASCDMTTHLRRAALAGARVREPAAHDHRAYRAGPARRGRALASRSSLAQRARRPAASAVEEPVRRAAPRQGRAGAASAASPSRST